MRKNHGNPGNEDEWPSLVLSLPASKIEMTNKIYFSLLRT